MRLPLAHVTDTRGQAALPPSATEPDTRTGAVGLPVRGAAGGWPCCTRQVILARKDNQAWAAGELGCPVIAAPYGCRRPYMPCLFSQPRQASATSRQPESMVRE